MRHLRRCALLALSAGLIAASLAVAEPATSVPVAAPARPLIPLPVVATDGAGEPFMLRPSLAVVAPGAAAPIGHQLAAQLRRSTGYRVPVVGRAGGPAIRIDVDPAASYTVDGKAPTAESYQLDVTAGGVEVLARTAHGAFNGVQTLRQLLPAWAEAPTAVRTGWQIRPIHVEDAPRFSYRYHVTGLQYLQRQNARNGRIKDYQIAVSPDATTWTDVAAGSFTETLAPQNVEFPGTPARYVRLTGLNSHPGNAFAGAAELNLGGTP